MKFLPLLCLFVVSAFAGEQATQTLSSQANPRTSTVTGYMDYWSVAQRNCRVISIYGYNSGPQQWVQLFDTGQSNAVLSITAWSGTPTYTNGAHNLSMAQPIQFTNTVNGITAGIYYARPIDLNSFQVFDTAAHANGSGTTGRQGSGGASGTGTALLLPTHSFAVASADNYSCIVQNTGFSFGKGLLISTSSTGPTYTPTGTTNITACVTVGSPL